jgi:hexosaminidase
MVATLLVPLAVDARIGHEAPLDGSHGLVVIASTTGAAGVAGALQADLDRVLGPPGPRAPQVLLRIDGEAPPITDPEHGAYTLIVDAGGATASAASPAGLAHAAATFRQLVGASGTAAAATITDRPRFPWRGLLVDCARHFQPIEALTRTVDAMAAAKLDVLHLHLTDDQAWRVESAVVPELTRVAAPGGHYTATELRALVAHAADRGVRVVPELDVPGHTSALLRARPDVALGEAPSALPTSWWVPGVSIDPDAPDTMSVLADLLAEWADIFPDPFVHIGGDEVPVLGADRQAAFTAAVVDLLAGLDRSAVVWDEALHPDLPREVVVQAWRSPALLHEAVRAGHRALLSSGWYLDLGVPVPHLHAVDPLAGPPELQAAVLAPWRDRRLSGRAGSVAARTVLQAGALDGAEPLTDHEAALVLGGETCLWTERVTPELLDTTLWPQATSVADRLWSDATALAALDPVLVERRYDLLPDLRRWTAVRAGAGPRRILAALAERFDHPEEAELALAELADWCEPVRWYARATDGWADANGRRDDVPPPGADHPLDRFVDALVVECAGHRRWRRALQEAPEVTAGDRRGDALALVPRWRHPASALGAGDGTYRTAEPLALATRLAQAADLLEGILTAGTPFDPEAVERVSAPAGDANLAVWPVFDAITRGG